MKELSIKIPEKDSYIKYPKGLFSKTVCGRRARTSEQAISAEIHTFSRGEGKRCNLSYADFAKKLGLSLATVARSIAALKEDGGIEQDKSRYACASYKYKKEVDDSTYIRTDLYLYTTEFAIPGEASPRRLKRSEILVFGLISTHCNNRKKDKEEFSASARSIASQLGMSKETVKNAISVLLRAGLLYRDPSERGVNGHKTSKYHINAKLIRKMKRAQKAQKPATTAPRHVIEADQRAERERFYALRRDKAERKAIACREYALKHAVNFKYLENELGKIEYSLARAELKEDFKTLSELQTKKIRLKDEFSKVLATIGMKESDLHPVYACSKCSDTGFDTHGRACDCYSRLPEGGGT